MKSLIIKFKILTLISMIIRSSYASCICNVQQNGEYCGTELNRINGNNCCSRDMFFCGDSNRNRSAALLVKCMTGSECDVVRNGGNACLQNIRCQCANDSSSGVRYCGNELIGRDCGPNVVFECGTIGLPLTVDGCVNTCFNGMCF